MTASEMASLSLRRLSSLNACLKFRSTGSWTWLRLSQVRRRSMVLFMDAASGRPEASLLTGLITVARPMSCMVSDVGAPALARSPCSSCENDRHSGPDSCIFSVTTYPHFEQNISPDSLSVTSLPLAHLGQVSWGLAFSTISLHRHA